MRKSSRRIEENHLSHRCLPGRLAKLLQYSVNLVNCVVVVNSDQTVEAELAASLVQFVHCFTDKQTDLFVCCLQQNCSSQQIRQNNSNLQSLGYFKSSKDRTYSIHLYHVCTHRIHDIIRVFAHLADIKQANFHPGI